MSVLESYRLLSLIIRKTRKLLAPPPKLTVSEWADINRRLSPEASAETGQWDTSRAEYQRGIMDTLSDPLVETIVVMSSAQIGKTEIVNNIAGFFIDQDPAPILVLQPTDKMGQAWSKDRLAPMLRDTDCLREKVKDVKSRSSGNTILHKVFPGGHITISGANSPASLASRPIRIVICDEVDKYPHSAGSEGDPVNLAVKRATTFWNRKVVLTSTPTVKDFSRIEAAFDASDQRKFYVPCPKCNSSQLLLWGQVKWEKDKPEDAWYECDSCKAILNDSDITRMVKSGNWKAEAEFKGTAGFWLNEIYSPWVSLKEMVTKFLESKGNPETLKTFVNTSLGETWEEDGEKVDNASLYARRERYGPEIPELAAVLTAGVDVQDDRIEVEVVAWGKGEESWSMEYRVFHGDPAGEDIWDDLDIFLQSTYCHESGTRLRIVSVCIDSGGHHTQRVYRFVKPRQVRRVFAIKGSNQAGKPLVGKWSINNLGKVKLFSVGTDTAKDLIYGRLKIESPGAGYCHFPDKYGEDYFKQLTSEKVVTKYVKGFSKRVYVLPSGRRNEALDCRVYATATLMILNPNLEKLVDDILTEAEEIETETIKPQVPKSFLNRKKKRGGFVNRGRW